MLRMTAQHVKAELAGQRGKQGFTFAEVMVALLIMVMLAAFVGTALQVAVPTYRKVVSDTNAQVALSTTTSALRDELGLATDVKPAQGGTVLYQTSEGTWAKIENGSKGLVKHEYADAGPQGAGADLGKSDLIPITMIEGASGADSRGENLRVEMTANDSGAYITYADGVFTVHGIRVLMGDTPIESISEYKVKAVFDPKL